MHQTENKPEGPGMFPYCLCLPAFIVIRSWKGDGLRKYISGNNVTCLCADGVSWNS